MTEVFTTCASANCSACAEVKQLRAHVAACQAMHDADQEEIQRLREGRPLEVVDADTAVEILRLRREIKKAKAVLHRVEVLCEEANEWGAGNPEVILLARDVFTALAAEGMAR